MPSVAPESPARGTRPRNRRALTVDAATELFYRLGYANVGMSDIATATNVGASALYRHFPSKADLLVAAIDAGITPYREVIEEAGRADGNADDRLAAALSRLASVAIEQRRLGVLWQREARNLSDAERRGPREALAATAGGLSALILASRRDLDDAGGDILAWCSLGMLVSISFHSLELPRARFANLLTEMGSTICAMSIAGAAPAPTARKHERTEPESRRDGLITMATELFADRGYAATGIDDIGDAVGIAGPSVYSHFANKQAILVAAIQRATRLMVSDSATILDSVDDAPAKLRRLIDSYVTLANSDRFVIRTIVSEMEELPADERTIARRVQRQYIDSWVELLRQFTPIDPVSARIRVQAVLLVVNDAVQTPHLRAQPYFEQTLERLSKALLGVASE